jgi:hypothetical protein
MAVAGTVTANENGTVRFTTVCMLCGQPSALDQLDPERVARWQAGAYARDAFPAMSASEREVLVSGSHAECFEESFPEDEDDVSGLRPDETDLDDEAWRDIPGAMSPDWNAYFASKPGFKPGV